MIANSFGFFDRSIFELQSISYKSYQENGTKYIKSRKVLDDKLQQQLNSCAGEVEDSNYKILFFFINFLL